MKILHTADWHLGKKLEGISRLDEQREVLQEICEIAEREEVHAVLIAGDLFDTYNPSSEAEELYYKSLKRLAGGGRRAVIAIAGNHDSPERIEAPSPLAEECGIIFAGRPNCEISPFKLDTGLEVTKSEAGFIEMSIPGISFPLRLLLTPYANEYRLRKFLSIADSEAELRKALQQHWVQLAGKYCDAAGVNLLLAHFFFAKEGRPFPDEPEDEKPILHVGGAQAIFSGNIPKGLHYAAVGHLHRKQTVDEEPCPLLYSGSPISYSFSEAGQEKSVTLIEAVPGKKVEYSTLKLSKGRPLIKKRFADVDKAAAWLARHKNAIVELTLATEEYLSVKDKNRLYHINPDIFIIPELNNQLLTNAAKIKEIDLSQSIEALFMRYFEFRQGQPPNEDILALFKEVLAEEPDV